MILLFAGVGYWWRSQFVMGDMGGPFWLLRAYQEGAPILFYMAAAGAVFVFILRLLTGLMRFKPGQDSDRLFVALRLAVVLGGAAALPACETQYKLIDSEEFAGDYYHLVQMIEEDRAAYGVFLCEDVGSMYCRIVGEESRPWHGSFPPPAPTPTPLPTIVVEVEGEAINLEPRGPTPTPPAEFLINAYDIHGTAEQELAVRIGEGFLGVAHVVVEGTPEP